MINNNEWNIMEIISENKRIKRNRKRLFKMIDTAKISCYDNLEVYYGLDYMNYIPEKNFIEFMELWLETFDTCCICGEDVCNCFPVTIEG